MFQSSYTTSLNYAAQQLGMNPDWLKNVITLESDWNPAAYNASGAVGLIQFMPDTLKDLGLLSSALAAQVSFEHSESEAVKKTVKQEFMAKYPTVDSQLLGPVITYFKRLKPFPTEQSVYMAVFYPKFRSVDPATPFPDTVKKQNPGIDTVSDYIALVKKKSNPSILKKLFHS